MQIEEKRGAGGRLQKKDVVGILGNQGEICQRLYERGRLAELDYIIGSYAADVVECKDWPTVYFMDDGSKWIEQRGY